MMELPTKISLRRHEVQVRINQPTRAKTWKQPKCLSIDKWIKKM